MWTFFLSILSAEFLMAVFTIRSQRSWLLFVSVPLFANGLLLFLLWAMPEVLRIAFFSEGGYESF